MRKIPTFKIHHEEKSRKKFKLVSGNPPGFSRLTLETKNVAWAPGISHGKTELRVQILLWQGRGSPSAMEPQEVERNFAQVLPISSSITSLSECVAQLRRQSISQDLHLLDLSTLGEESQWSDATACPALQKHLWSTRSSNFPDLNL